MEQMFCEFLPALNLLVEENIEMRKTQLAVKADPELCFGGAGEVYQGEGFIQVQVNQIVGFDG